MRKSLEEVKPDLEIEEHLDAHKQGFKVQVIGLIMIFLMVLAAAVGVFGDGLLSKKVLASNTATIEYERFYRHEARMELKINLLNSTTSRQTVSFPVDYLKNLKLESTTPTALSSAIRGNNIEYVFDGSGSGILYFYLVPQEAGNMSGEILVNGDPFRLSHFIYP